MNIKVKAREDNQRGEDLKQDVYNTLVFRCGNIALAIILVGWFGVCIFCGFGVFFLSGKATF